MQRLAEADRPWRSLTARQIRDALTQALESSDQPDLLVKIGDQEISAIDLVSVRDGHEQVWYLQVVPRAPEAESRWFK